MMKKRGNVVPAFPSEGAGEILCQPLQLIPAQDIALNPGAKLPRRKHFHREECRSTVNGGAIITGNDEVTLCRALF
jgi:hypothetical protein